MEHDTKVIVTCNQKGGVGKTTSTVNLAATTADLYPPEERTEVPAGAELDERYQAQVLVVSTDPQASMLEWLDRVNKAMKAAEKPMPLDYAQEHTNPRVLKKLKSARQYRRIFVDSPGWLEGAAGTAQTPATEEQILRATLESADLVIVPIVPEQLSFKPTRRTIEEVIKPMGLPFVVVINNWDPRDGEGDKDDTVDWARKHKYPLASTVIRRYKLHAKAPALGALCTQYPKNRTAVEAHKDYLSLGMELGLGGGL